MNDRMIAKGLTVTCADGTTRSDVVMLLRHGKRVYQAPSGETLCVKQARGGVYGVSPMTLTAICCSCPLEEE